MRGLLMALVVAASACGAGVEQVDLELRNDQPNSCAAPAMANITVLSVEVLGVASGELCSLGKRCLFDVPALQTLDDVRVALRDAQPPLVDVAAADAAWIAVIGHTDSCWSFDDHAMCGLADLADSVNNTLPVTLECTGCSTEPIPFCP